MYTIETDLRLKLLRITMSGFFDPEEVAIFTLDLRKAIAVVSGGNAYSVLVDMRTCSLQSQAMVEAFQRFIEIRPHHAKRIALLAGKSVSRMQARRLLVDDRVRMFEDDADASNWAMSPFGGSQNDGTAHGQGSSIQVSARRQG
jgi:hypothetical protein